IKSKERISPPWRAGSLLPIVHAAERTVQLPAALAALAPRLGKRRGRSAATFGSARMPTAKDTQPRLIAIGTTLLSVAPESFGAGFHLFGGRSPRHKEGD